MDNVTHSLTGALAATLLQRPSASTSERRTLLWLLVVSANLPDLDVVLQLFTDRLTYIIHHRGITHSLLFAPVFALVPALVFFSAGKFKRFGVLWSAALVGIVVHILFDLITPFGTMIVAPLSQKRFALDWMFIIDPVVTLLLALPFVARIWAIRRQAMLFRVAGALLILYLAAGALAHHLALQKVESVARSASVRVLASSALPQPLSIFSWNGLIQTPRGVHRMFFSPFDDTVRVQEFKNEKGKLVDAVLHEQVVQRYLSFARHPWISLSRNEEGGVVEIQDLQFSVDERVLARFGLPAWQPPFRLQLVYAPDGTLTRALFDGKQIPR